MTSWTSTSLSRLRARAKIGSEQSLCHHVSCRSAALSDLLSYSVAQGITRCGVETGEKAKPIMVANSFYLYSNGAPTDRPPRCDYPVFP